MYLYCLKQSFTRSKDNLSKEFKDFEVPYSSLYSFSPSEVKRGGWGMHVYPLATFGQSLKIIGCHGYKILP